MTLTKPPVIPEGWNPVCSQSFNSCMQNVKKELLPKGVKKRKSKPVIVNKWEQNKLRIA